MVFTVLRITFSRYVYIIARLLCHLNFPDMKLGGLEGIFGNQQQEESMRVCPVAPSCLTLCDSVDWSPPGSSCPWDFPGKTTVVGSSWVEAWNSACLSRCPRGERPLVELSLEPGVFFRTMHGKTAPSC